jgi:hypothetical protein
MAVGIFWDVSDVSVDLSIKKLQKESVCNPFFECVISVKARNDVQVFERLLKMNAVMQRIANDERAKLGKAPGATVDRTLH